jgi:hypothetical protein
MSVLEYHLKWTTPWTTESATYSCGSCEGPSSSARYATSMVHYGLPCLLTCAHCFAFVRFSFSFSFYIRAICLNWRRRGPWREERTRKYSAKHGTFRRPNAVLLVLHSSRPCSIYILRRNTSDTARMCASSHLCHLLLCLGTDALRISPASSSLHSRGTPPSHDFVHVCHDATARDDQGWACRSQENGLHTCGSSLLKQLGDLNTDEVHQ